MCAICGCDGHHEHVHAEGTRHSHAHGHEHHHHVELEARVLAKNDALADRNRTWLEERRLAALNLMGAPGSGKTTLLERTIAAMPAGRLSVIEGDQATANDAERIQAAGARVVQINTGTGCHLDASMVAHALEHLAPPPQSAIVIENVGNLVCPALFQLGERRRIVVLSCAEGDDKPVKYPHMFRAADVVVISKIDLLPHVDFDLEKATGHMRMLNPHAVVMPVSARTGDGMQAWCRWLAGQLEGLAHRGERRVERPANAGRIEL